MQEDVVETLSILKDMLWECGKKKKKKKENRQKNKLTFPMTASVAFDVDSGTFEHFEPESYLPSAYKTGTEV